MIAIVDYGMGNLRSVEKALHKLGHAAEVTADPAAVARAERVILPGVGAFGAAMRHLQEAPELLQAVRQAIRDDRPFFGICLGMQLLLEGSEESPGNPGLGAVAGTVRRFDFGGDASLKIPHMGWNGLRFPRPTPLFKGLEDGVSVYFVHSYYCVPTDPVATAATCDHGGEFCAAIARDNVFAVQFHPEKSGAAGLQILSNFASL